MDFKSQTLSNGGVAMKRPSMFIFLLVTSLLWQISGASAQTQFSEAGVEKFRVPVEAPDFTLQEIGGEKVSLKELRGKIILLNFFASW
jgi:cytochrome oxidase Cu insertion factor (SCO1/SenC/PrrC family)